MSVQEDLASFKSDDADSNSLEGIEHSLQRVYSKYDMVHEVTDHLVDKVTNVISRQHNEYLTAYKAHMFNLQKEVANLKAQAQDIQNETRKNARLRQLKEESDRFEKRALALDRRYNQLTRKVRKKRREVSQLEKDRNWLIGRVNAEKAKFQQRMQAKSVLFEEEEVQEEEERDLSVSDSSSISSSISATSLLILNHTLQKKEKRADYERSKRKWERKLETARREREANRPRSSSFSRRERRHASLSAKQGLLRERKEERKLLVTEVLRLRNQKREVENIVAEIQQELEGRQYHTYIKAIEVDDTSAPPSPYRKQTVRKLIFDIEEEEEGKSNPFEMRGLPQPPSPLLLDYYDEFKDEYGETVLTYLLDHYNRETAVSEEDSTSFIKELVLHAPHLLQEFFTLMTQYPFFEAFDHHLKFNQEEEEEEDIGNIKNRQSGAFSPSKLLGEDILSFLKDYRP